MSEIKAVETHESEEAHKKGGSLLVLSSLICLLLAYLLSIGPVARFYRGRGVPSAVRAFYAPIALTYEHSDKVRQAFDWYVGLWGSQM